MAVIDSFPDAEEHLARRHAVRRVRTFCDEVDGIGPRALIVRIERLQGLGRWWFGLAARICREADVHASSALRHNARLALGALATEDGFCWLRAVLPSPVSPTEIDVTIDDLAAEAARILDIPQLPDGRELFGNLAD